ncbi:isochorismatase family protein [Aciditerrimonas ferrireducens]|uniref:isochorismatase family protein n=1 Tax=Aciditerrimonas ferrireducens TaxID=667306 RepID=UPI002005BC9A|nr:isochorismatase family protein [Aciditerrimonas ferrireducens]MCK4176479.1 isochorismatase family protein [Aciditerrimonas ferrireducens]
MAEPTVPARTEPAQSESDRTEPAPPVADGRAEDSARAGFLGRLGWGRAPALVLVDALAAYSTPGSPLYLAEGPRVVAAMAELLRAARAGGRPVFWPTVRYPRGAVDAPLFFAKVPALAAFVAGSPLGAFCEGLQPAAGEAVVEKRYASAFFGTDLASSLVQAGVDTVVLAGFSTSGCVRASALDALQHGFRPLVVAEAVADRDPATQEQNLFDLQAKYADVIGLGEALSGLLGEGAGSGARREAS